MTGKYAESHSRQVFFSGIVWTGFTNPTKFQLFQWKLLSFLLQALGMEGAAEEVQWVVEISGSTRSTLLHGKIHPKDWQVASPLVMSRVSPIFLGLFQVIMANPGFGLYRCCSSMTEQCEVCVFLSFLLSITTENLKDMMISWLFQHFLGDVSPYLLPFLGTHEASWILPGLHFTNMALENLCVFLLHI